MQVRTSHRLARPFVWAVALLPFIAATAFVPLPAVAEAGLEAGDVIELSVAGIPELRQRSMVNLDGEVSLPLIGGVKVIGLSLPELRAKIRSLVSNKTFRQRAAEGRENIIAIWPDEIMVDVVEYRPIYLNGDISRPGDQRHRPGMTVRQAVALAGGYDIMRFRLNNPAMESADLKSEYRTLWTELVREQANLQRIEAELGSPPKMELDISKTPIPPELAAQIIGTESEQLKVREAAYQKEKAHYNHSIELTESQLSVLADQQRRTEEGTKADAVDLENVKDLQRKGVVPVSRLLEARRSLLWSSTSFVQSIAQVSQINKDREELRRRLSSLDDQRRIDLLRERQTSVLRTAAIRIRLEAVGEKLIYSTAARSQLVHGKGATPDITIVRKNNQGWRTFAAGEEEELLPGDTVEVTLRPEHVAGLPAGWESSLVNDWASLTSKAHPAPPSHSRGSKSVADQQHKPLRGDAAWLDSMLSGGRAGLLEAIEAVRLMGEQLNLMLEEEQSQR
jgi:polysaccharide export outer membrane protein